MVKQSACTNLRGNLWLKDKTRVGFKLMKKMGWSEGKGLGSKEDGIKEAIKVRPKNDAKGVGFHENSDNNWLEHQDEFNALLSRLNKNNVEPSMKMISLEEKSKSSRSRLHYHKYTRGKDLSSCSDKDLACILGKRKNKKITAELDTSNIVFSKMNSQDYLLHKQGLLGEEKEECDHLQLECLSKKKKHKRKNETYIHENHACLSAIDNEECDSLQLTHGSLKKKNHKKNETFFCETEKVDDAKVVIELGETAVKKKKQELSQEINEHLPSITRHKNDFHLKVKSKHDLRTCEETVHTGETCFGDDKIEALKSIETRAKKQRSNEKSLSISEVLVGKPEVSGELYLPKQKKKLKPCNDEIHQQKDDIQDTFNITVLEVKPNEKKFKKTRSRTYRDDVTTLIEDKINIEELEPSTLEPVSIKAKKIKLKKKDDKSNECNLMASADDNAEDETGISKREFVIGLLTTFRHPSENLPDLFNDIMKGEPFNGSNFFCIKGYGREWL